MSDCKCWKCEALVENGRRLERGLLRRMLKKIDKDLGYACRTQAFRNRVYTWLHQRTESAKRKDGGR